ncbi:hypothetical protein BC567DRAFT_210065 [Phyllosticta citribraziliensis]
MAPQDSRKTSQQEKELEESFEQIDELEMQEIRRQDECEPFETISDAEAQEQALLPKKDPTPEELHCPCWSVPEGGWRYCFVESHVRAAIKRIEEGPKTQPR